MIKLTELDTLTLAWTIGTSLVVGSILLLVS